MKESVFDILIYLFENYINDEVELEPDREELNDELVRAGFRDAEINKAFDWLEGLAKLQDRPTDLPLRHQQSIRIYSERECEKLDTDCRGFLLFLEQMGVLDHTTREMVVDRIMALGGEDAESVEAVDLDQLKWVILMVLFNQPGQEAAFAWMEDLVLDEFVTCLH